MKKSVSRSEKNNSATIQDKGNICSNDTESEPKEQVTTDDTINSKLSAIQLTSAEFESKWKRIYIFT